MTIEVRAGTAEIILVRPLRRVLGWLPAADGRLVLLAAVAAYLAIIAAGRLVWGVDLWPFSGVPSGPSLFFDARNLTAAWECQRLGYDPLYENPCDPWGRPLMYLRPWLLLGVLGLDQSHTFALSAVLIGAMFLSFSAPRRSGAGRNRHRAGACRVLAGSHVCRRAGEHGHRAVLARRDLRPLWRAFPGPARVVSPVLVLLAATAKMYPVFALPAFVVARSRVAAVGALICVAVFGVYCVYSLRDVDARRRDRHPGAALLLRSPHPASRTCTIRWAPTVGRSGGSQATARRCTARVHRGGDRRSGPPPPRPARLRRRLPRPRSVALHAGALIYLGTFAAANNFDYRLVFLLLTLPQLVEWARMPAHRLSSLASATLVGDLVLLWVGSLSQWLNLWDELASWAVAGLLAAVVAATVPSLECARKSVLGAPALTAPTT